MHGFENRPSPLDPPISERVRALPGAVLLTIGYFLSRIPTRPRR